MYYTWTAHPNVKLFITHGGLLSHTEAVHFGVPLLAIPIFGDQFQNAKTLENKGNGLKLEFSNITETSFQWALTEALENSKYVYYIIINYLYITGYNLNLYDQQFQIHQHSERAL